MGFGRRLGRWRARFAAPGLSQPMPVACEALMRRGSCQGTRSAGFLRAVFDG